MTQKLRLTQIKSINFHEGNGIDVVTGLSAGTYYGRPDWAVEFRNIQIKHSNSDTGVFYCGPTGLARELEKQCMDLSLGNSRFFFHKENF